MYIIQEHIVDESLIEQRFVCNLSKCKGACCIEGDGGAPLKPVEIDILTEEYPKYAPFLTPEGREKIEEDGFFYKDPEEKTLHTPLLANGACAYIQYNGDIAECGIEKAYKSGATNFRKPISCHLFPIRVSEAGTLHALNYYEWDICEPACSLGNELKIPVYKFLKEPIIRAYGEKFFEILDGFAQTKNP